ncbi:METHYLTRANSFERASE [Fusobacterium vincentii ATCC 49256]|uniref:METHYLTRANSFERASE n=1 Tax=Fusobacterium vincentii ATCC 49256 TaxID=209882 RepID=Q7P2P0_FUSVC|nr:METHYLTRANSFERASE [Fusobacterium vincentii ATCC 49256]
MKIIQRSDYFNFSIDSLLISEFVNIQKNTKKILDLGTGKCSNPTLSFKKNIC